MTREIAKRSVAVVASIALTPIVWEHYFVLLIVPLALARPKLSWAWGLMWVFWVIPTPGNNGELWRIVVAVTVVGVVLVVAVLRTRRVPLRRVAT